MLVLRAITDYLATREDLSSIKSIRPRLNHVVQYIAHLGTPEVRCGRIDEAWVERFRKWLLAQPVVLTSGEHRSTPRSLSAAENSVIQLAAAINSAHARGDISKPAQFRPIPTKDVNRTPERRLSIIELSEAFRYASDPRYPVKRIGLHRFLILSVATAARPDAVHDFSTKPARRQWNTERGIIALNPAGRRQTRKRRAIVLAPAQVVPLINSVDGFFVPAISVKGAWESMVDKLGWPRDGDGGMKLIRRSVSQLIRDAGTPRAWSVDWQDPTRKVPTEQIEVQLGHRVIESVTDLYAAFDPDYQRLITSAIEAVIDEIERLCPGAFTLRPPADRSSKEGA